MTLPARALFGVALGSCLTLFLHPGSRRYMLGLLPKPQETRILSQATRFGSGTMPEPKSVADAGLWMELGAEKLGRGGSLSTTELKSLAGLAHYMGNWTAAGSNERLNAFWPQMEAVFLKKLGDDEGARKAWTDASKRGLWRDYQASRLIQTANEMGSREGPMAWHLAAVYYARRFDASARIKEYALSLLDSTGKSKPDPVLVKAYLDKQLVGTGLESQPDLEVRFETLRNADLIAAGAQSLQALHDGVEIARWSALPANSPPFTKPAMISKYRGAFYDGLNRFGISDYPGHRAADTAAMYYDQIDSQPVLTQSFNPVQNAARISAFTILTASLPGALFIVAIVGGVILGLSALVLRYADGHAGFSWPPTLAVGTALGAGVYSVTLPLASLVFLLCFMFLTFSPKVERSRVPPELGTVFRWTVTIISILFAVSLIAFMCYLSAPAKILVPAILDDFSVYAGNRSILIGLSAILLALLLLTAPMFAFGFRIRTPLVFAHVLRTSGLSLVLAGLIGVVFLAPLSVAADSWLGQTMKELVGNEQVHYDIVFQ